MSERVIGMNGTIVYRSICLLMLLIQVVLVTLYLAGVITANTILIELTTIDLIIPVCVVVIIMYYSCKFSGVPQARYSESKTKALTISVVIWSILRIF